MHRILHFVSRSVQNKSQGHIQDIHETLHYVGRSRKDIARNFALCERRHASAHIMQSSVQNYPTRAISDHC